MRKAKQFLWYYWSFIMIVLLQINDDWDKLLPYDVPIDIDIEGYDLTQHGFGFAFLILTVLFAPLWEEGVFRGIIPWITKKFTQNKWIVFAVSSILFGVAHLSSGEENAWIQVIYASFIGMYFMGLRLEGKSLWLLIGMHFVINYVSVVTGDSTIEERAFDLSDFLWTIGATGLMAVNGILVMTMKLNKENFNN